MSACDERRIQGIKRVNVATLVEICGNQPGVPAFEAQSLDVSGRGMHVKTGYVPKVGDPLICRFENQGQEIVVEGVVAWRREGEQGGDFGIEFTALDSSSVDALRTLCGVAPATAAEKEPIGAHAPEPKPDLCASGAKVRLHIDGLGSPMKANVREGGSRRLRVGSQLQFLQVGRHLEIEDVGVGARRNARIDSVDVRVDPRTQIPELVVALRYEGIEDTTPEPSVVDQSAEEALPVPRHAENPGARVVAGQATSVSYSDDADAQEAEAEMMAEQQAAEQARLAYDRIGQAAQGAAQVAKATGKTLAHFGHAAKVGAGSLIQGVGKQLLELKKQPKAAPKRQTAMPGKGVALAGSRLRPQQPGGSKAPQPGRASGVESNAKKNSMPAPGHPLRKTNRLALAAGALVVIGATAAYALRDVDGPGKTAALPALAASVEVSAPQAAKPATSSSPSTSKEAGGIVANVPLFGPTPLATMEPAPLGPAVEPEDEEAREKRAAAAAVDDATWGNDAAAAKPADVKPWGRGSMHLPTIHKLRLDAPGGAISGSVNATGFTVVVPGRKVMESGRAIQRRDQRITKVKTSNTARGAEVTFQFRDKVPAYRVRLRKDFAEFLISAHKD